MYNLGFGKGAAWVASEDTLTIYDTTTDAAESLIVLSSDQMHELVTYWHDGYCPICFEEIPQGHQICQDCSKQEREIWEGFEEKPRKAGRPRLSKDAPAMRLSTTVSPDILNYLKKVGEGNMSKGLRQVVKEHKTP